MYHYQVKERFNQRVHKYIHVKIKNTHKYYRTCLPKWSCLQLIIIICTSLLLLYLYFPLRKHLILRGFLISRVTQTFVPEENWLPAVSPVVVPTCLAPSGFSRRQGNVKKHQGVPALQTRYSLSLLCIANQLKIKHSSEINNDIFCLFCSSTWRT